MVALVGGMLVVASSPAQADAPTVAITEISTNMQSGDKTTFKYKVTNNNPTSTSFRIQVGGMDCSQACSSVLTIEGGAAREFVKTLTAPPVDPGDDESVEVAVIATVANNPGENDDAKQTVQVRGPDKPQTVRQISGRVRDTNGKAISGAQVILQDSANHKYETTSNNSGAYSFTSADDKPIVPGQVSIGAGKDGFKPAAISVQAAAGKTVNAPSLNLTSTVAVASPAPSATEGASSPPVDEETDDAADPAGETAAAADPASGEDSSSSSLLFIILGGLLVAAGIGAIVLVLMRRRGNDDDEADLLGGAIPPSKGGGRYGDATRLAAPAGAGANDATMVASMSGPPLSMSDAPTTLLQSPIPADDEFPDPYGAPAQVAHGGYTPVGAGTYGADAPVQSGYEDEYARPATQYGRSAQQQQEEYGGYVPPAADQRYDEQTGMYRPEPPYVQPAYEEPAYAQPAYGQPAYGQPAYEQPAYEQPAYEQPAHEQPAHGQPAFEEPAYGQPAYEQPAEYGGGYQGAAYGRQAQPDDYGLQPEPSHGSWDAPAEGGKTYGAAPASGVYGGRAQSSDGGAPGGGAPAPSVGGAYGAPVQGGTYGAAAPTGNDTYGAPGGYAAPAQRGGTYGGAPSHGGDQGGYDPRATYGRPGGQEPAPSRGSQQGVYGGGPAGYDQGGHDQGDVDQGSYDQNGYDQNGYDRGGYDQQGTRRHGGPARSEPTPPGQRRPVDWLDD